MSGDNQLAILNVSPNQNTNQIKLSNGSFQNVFLTSSLPINWPVILFLNHDFSLRHFNESLGTNSAQGIFSKKIFLYASSDFVYQMWGPYCFRFVWALNDIYITIFYKIVPIDFSFIYSFFKRNAFSCNNFPCSKMSKGFLLRIREIDGFDD